MVDWPPERIAELATGAIKTLRKNAIRLEQNSVLTLCDAELLRRASTSEKAPGGPKLPVESRRGQVVIGFHFVCPQEKGVTRKSDGTFWTGTWVVDQVHAERAAKIRAYVALHTSKSEPSYLQGTVKDWRKSERDRQYAEGRAVKIEFGIDFLGEITNEPYGWNGDGSGEKGYVWGTPKEIAEPSPSGV
jgi:hypothetical protein